MAVEGAKSQLDASTLSELRRRLEEEATRLKGLLDVSSVPDHLDGTNDALANDPEDFGDMGQDITTADTELALSANDRQLLAQVEHALQRMGDGTYGLSEVSGKPIPVERLEALPWATTNVDDAGPRRRD
jgi:RNA polymerase-binding transcription factor DksA